MRESANVLLQYRNALYAFFRARGMQAEEAEDLVQGFFEAIVCRRDFLAKYSRTGRFRDWLKECALNYLRDHLAAKGAQKRRPPGGIISLDRNWNTDGNLFEPMVDDPPDAAYHDAWRRDLLRRALATVRDESKKRGRSRDYEIFVEYYMADATCDTSWKKLAARYGLDDWKIAARKAEWVKRRLARAIRAEIRQYVESDEELELEIRELLE